ncbi:MAG: glycoside hydrolase [Lachnospiraceae bacterium]
MRKIISFILAGVLILTGCPAMGVMDMKVQAETAATLVTLDPSNHSEVNNGIFEGWGTSLCWWANRIGYDETLTEQAAELFYSEDGLGLDIARYNIGGGDDPTHDHIIRSDSKLPGFAVPEKDENGDYILDENGIRTYTLDWDRDPNQMNVLMKSLEKNQDIVVEGFSNSPPYFMTESGCSSGGINGADNISEKYFEPFADFLCQVAVHFRDDLGITFDSLEPLNEPGNGGGKLGTSSTWNAYNQKQEGCNLYDLEMQSKLLVTMKNSMKKYGLDDMLLAAADEGSFGLCERQLTGWSEEAKAAVDRMDYHTYKSFEGYERQYLDLLKEAGISGTRMSEVDNGGKAGSGAGNMAAGLNLANYIIRDVNGVKPSAWIMWNILDYHKDANFYYTDSDGEKVYSETDKTLDQNAGIWGIGMADHDDKEIDLTQKYYVFGQFTKYINPGDRIIGSSNRTLAAYNKESGDIKIVAVNTAGTDQAYEFDLSAFQTVGNTVTETRTSGAFEGGEHWAAINGEASLEGKVLSTTLKANSVTTYVISGNEEPISYFVLNGEKTVVNGTETQYLIASDIDNLPAASWEVSNSDVADISQDGVLTAKKDGKVTVTVTCGSYSDSMEVRVVTPIELNEAMITGSDPWSGASDLDAVSAKKTVDGDVSTYFDGVQNGYVIIDLGYLYDLSALAYCPRKGNASRMLNGVFYGSTDGVTWDELYKVTETPADGMMTTADATGRYRYVKYSQTTTSANIAEIALYGTFVEGQIQPVQTSVDEFTDDFEGESNIFGVTEKTTWSGSTTVGESGVVDGNQLFACGLETYNNVLVPANATATATLEQPIVLGEDADSFSLSFTLFSGWERNGKENTFALLNSDGTELVKIRTSTGGYRLEEVSIDGTNTLEESIAGGVQALQSGTTGANNWSDSRYTDIVENNKTVIIKVEKDGNITVSFTGGLKGSLTKSAEVSSAKLDVQSIRIVGAYASDAACVASYDNFTAWTEVVPDANYAVKSEEDTYKVNVPVHELTLKSDTGYKATVSSDASLSGKEVQYTGGENSVYFYVPDVNTANLQSIGLRFGFHSATADPEEQTVTVNYYSMDSVPASVNESTVSGLKSFASTSSSKTTEYGYVCDTAGFDVENSYFKPYVTASTGVLIEVIPNGTDSLYFDLVEVGLAYHTLDRRAITTDENVTIADHGYVGQEMTVAVPDGMVENSLIVSYINAADKVDLVTPVKSADKENEYFFTMPDGDVKVSCLVNNDPAKIVVVGTNSSYYTKLDNPLLVTFAIPALPDGNTYTYAEVNVPTRTHESNAKNMAAVMGSASFTVTRGAVSGKVSAQDAGIAAGATSTLTITNENTSGVDYYYASKDGCRYDSASQLSTLTLYLEGASAVPTGDMNQDNKVTAVDALLILLTKNPTEAQLQLADMNRNGSFDQEDARMVLDAAIQ